MEARTYRIPVGGIKVSTNKIYAGEHWSKRKSVKDSVYGYAKHFCRPALPLGSYPVSIRYRFLFVTRPLDSLNCAYMAKMFEDALRAIGILEDDDPAHVAESILSPIIVSRAKGKKIAPSSGAETDAQNEDILEIIITPYEPSKYSNDGSRLE